jgi:antitoxin (DNA-binding transcriptional repressor) of toxin-antitoxin stability system
MRTVNIAELKNRLSTYIAYAKAGETILIRDRNTAVAQLMPLLIDDGLSREERELVASGLLRPGRRPRDLAELDHLPWPKVEGNAGTQAILDEREESM